MSASLASGSIFPPSSWDSCSEMQERSSYVGRFCETVHQWSQKCHFWHSHVSFWRRIKNKSVDVTSTIRDVLKQGEEIGMDADPPRPAGRCTPLRATFAMSNDKSESQLVHKESPPPAYEASAILQQPYPISHNDNIIPGVLSPQAFEVEYFRDGYPPPSRRAPPHGSPAR